MRLLRPISWLVAVGFAGACGSSPPKSHVGDPPPCAEAVCREVSIAPKPPVTSSLVASGNGVTCDATLALDPFIARDPDPRYTEWSRRRFELRVTCGAGDVEPALLGGFDASLSSDPDPGAEKGSALFSEHSTNPCELAVDFRVTAGDVAGANAVTDDWRAEVTVKADSCAEISGSATYDIGAADFTLGDPMTCSCDVE